MNGSCITFEVKQPINSVLPCSVHNIEAKLVGNDISIYFVITHAHLEPNKKVQNIALIPHSHHDKGSPTGERRNNYPLKTIL